MATVSDWTYQDGLWLKDRASVIQEGRAWVAVVYGDRYPDDGLEVGRYVTAQAGMRACDSGILPVDVDAQWRFDVVAIRLCAAGVDAAAKAASRGDR